MSQKVTARFFVNQITDYGNSNYAAVTLVPAYQDGQNKEWASATPSGKIELNIGADLPAAKFFRDLLRDKDHKVAVEFTVVDKGE